VRGRRFPDSDHGGWRNHDPFTVSRRPTGGTRRSKLSSSSVGQSDAVKDEKPQLRLVPIGPSMPMPGAPVA
jgi:hypothetical protein